MLYLVCLQWLQYLCTHTGEIVNANTFTLVCHGLTQALNVAKDNLRGRNRFQLGTFAPGKTSTSSQLVSGLPFRLLLRLLPRLPPPPPVTFLSLLTRLSRMLSTSFNPACSGSLPAKVSASKKIPFWQILPPQSPAHRSIGTP